MQWTLASKYWSRTRSTKHWARLDSPPQLPHLIVSISGRAGDHLHGGLHHGDVHQDTRSGLHAPQGKLHEKSLELYGLLCCHLWVSEMIVSYIIINFLFK